MILLHTRHFSTLGLPLLPDLDLDPDRALSSLESSLAGADDVTRVVVGAAEDLEVGAGIPDYVAVGDLRVTALHTPGHMANHLSFALGDVVFTGDLVMGWSTSLVSPPDGDLGDFLRALDPKLLLEVVRSGSNGIARGERSLRA